MSSSFKPHHAEYNSGNIKYCCLFYSFATLAQVVEVEILTHGTQGHNENHFQDIPDSKVHGANMRPTWVLSAPDGPHVGPMNLAIRDDSALRLFYVLQTIIYLFTYQLCRRAWQTCWCVRRVSEVRWWGPRLLSVGQVCVRGWDTVIRPYLKAH